MVLQLEEAVVDIYVFASDRTTWILTSKGELYSCGQNNYGQQGSGNTSNVLTFTKREL
jgi:alpha-tubulin suppressor-like RCC1 family protein